MNQLGSSPQCSPRLTDSWSYLPRSQRCHYSTMLPELVLAGRCIVVEYVSHHKVKFRLLALHKLPQHEDTNRAGAC